MKSFEWSNPATVQEAVKMLTIAAPGDIDEAPRPIAGGQDLLTTMKDYTSRPARVVNLKRIRGLNNLSLNARGLTIGALVTLTELEEHAGVRKSFPGLVEAAHSIATPQIRNLGTVGGNLCQRPRCWYFRLEEVNCLKKGGSECYAANGENKYNAIIGGGPSYIVHPSDLAPMLLALGASVTVVGSSGKRVIPLDKFFTLPSEGNIRRENVLKNEEIITEIFVPASPLAVNSTYLKFKERESLDFALASAAVAVRLAPGHSVRDARIVLGGVAPIPWRVPAAEKFLTGKNLKPEVLA
ncbi:MAG TPA: xanthine dehydrogenase family protein subunit M [Pyrinomonadaceae bacterium]|nr:xanthine dehydrogenase family protein subunit M [Pyrinomonadaceae bacterium]